MIPKFRAWHKIWEEMGWIARIRYKKSGEIARLSFRRNIYDGNIYGGLVNLDEIELMQSTGLKDKNGKEIFEGDILTSQNYPVKGVVEFRTDLGLWVHYLKEYSYFEYLGNVAGSKEIIGNIYENPELLED